MAEKKKYTIEAPPPAPCPSCSSDNRELVSGLTIYPHRPDLDEKKFWRCSDCHDSYVGCHPGTEIPTGTLANAATRSARMAAHEAFDKLWKKEIGGKMRRKEAYAWLAETLELERRECHIGWFRVTTCERVVLLATNKLNDMAEADDAR